MVAQIKLNWYNVHLGMPQYIDSVYGWPEDTFIQAGGRGGSGLGNYETYFVEAYPDTFIRAEGSTLLEAEQKAWMKYVASLVCEDHSWESRGYRNGAAFCGKCNFFKSGHFTGEDLGQYCYKCNVPTTYSHSVTPDARISSKEETEANLIFVCKDHHQEHITERYTFLSQFPEREWSPQERSDVLQYRFFNEDDED